MSGNGRDFTGSGPIEQYFVAHDVNSPVSE
jgi:hypothetical protein